VKLRRRLIAVDRRPLGIAILASLGSCLVLALAATALAAPPRARAAKRPPAPASPTSGIASQSAAGSPATAPALSAHASILVEESTGQVLYASNANTPLAIASATKLMTALLTLEHVPHASVMFTAPNYRAAPGDSQIGLAPGERMSVHDLLLGLLIPSADDAAEDLAYNVGGHSVARFIGMMNARARELGLTHTHYSTPSGLDTPGNYSTATDLVKLSVYVLEHHPWFRYVVSLPHAVLRTGARPRYVVSTNTLLAQVPWINGVKTGHTGAAGYVLVGSGTRGGVTLLSAVLGTDSQAARNSNTLALLGYGFSNFRVEHPVVAGMVVARPAVADSPGVRVPVLATGGVSEVVARTATLTTRVDVPHQLAGPLPDHAVVGTLVVSAGRRVLARVPVELSRALPAVSQLTIIGRFLSRTSTLIVLVLLIGGASVLARRRWGSGRAKVTGHQSDAAAPEVVAERALAANRATAPEHQTPRPEQQTPAPEHQPAGPDPQTAGPEQAAVAERAAAIERELRRAEREARRRAGNSDAAPTSARDRG
jgi:D-alanyl-D-alanine carboxypeptidase (penicillin-binding protein 5/6)